MQTLSIAPPIFGTLDGYRVTAVASGNGACVQALVFADMVFVTDSKETEPNRLERPQLIFMRDDWNDFIGVIVAGRFDLPVSVPQDTAWLGVPGASSQNQILVRFCADGHIQMTVGRPNRGPRCGQQYGFVLTFNRGEWLAFLNGARGGEFSTLSPGLRRQGSRGPVRYRRQPVAA
jgi:hypothetical protein